MTASPMNQLNAHISTMIATGLLDEHFMALQSLQDAEDPDFIAGLVTTFLNDGDRMFGKLTQLLERLFMDFDALYKKLHELKGCSARVRLACIQLLQFIGEQKNKDELSGQSLHSFWNFKLVMEEQARPDRGGYRGADEETVDDGCWMEET
ncbi:hypothetical protein EJB05_30679, partial [Eragrostis curvula]